MILLIFSLLLVVMLILLLPSYIFATNKLLFPKSMFPESSAYKAGWSAGFLHQKFKGHHGGSRRTAEQ